jgi:hypothetical protein
MHFSWDGEHEIGCPYGNRREQVGTILRHTGIQGREDNRSLQHCLRVPDHSAIQHL